MAAATEFVGCAWLQHGFLSRNLAGGSHGTVGITIFSSLLFVSHSSCHGHWDWISKCVGVEGFLVHGRGWEVVDAL